MDNVILIIEKNRSKYTAEKMQSARMRTYILDSRTDTNVSAKIKEINKRYWLKKAKEKLAEEKKKEEE